MGRASSKPATIEQHLMDQNKKSKEFIQGFKEQVVQGRERVQDTLARLKQDLYAYAAPVYSTFLDYANSYQHQPLKPSRHRQPRRGLYRSRDSRTNPLDQSQPTLRADAAAPAPQPRDTTMPPNSRAGLTPAGGAGIAPGYVEARRGGHAEAAGVWENFWGEGC